jgi:hypothetical protein
MGVASGFLQAVLIIGRPHVKEFDQTEESDFSTSYKKLGPCAKLAISSIEILLMVALAGGFAAQKG